MTRFARRRSNATPTLAREQESNAGAAPGCQYSIARTRLDVWGTTALGTASLAGYRSKALGNTRKDFAR